MSRAPRYSEAQARAAIAAARSYTDALRQLGMRPAGGNHQTLRRYATEIWRIPTDHFDPYAERRHLAWRQSIPLEQVLVERSTYSRGSLKERLYASGLKQRACELCGQDEQWRGRRMALILDHVNGVADDNRLENLRIVCPNCAATLDMHCGRLTGRPTADRICQGCGETYVPNRPEQQYCRHSCWAHNKATGPQPHRRRVVRPPYQQLIADVRELGYRAVGRRYGVSDTSIRKWIQAYERESLATQAAA